MYPGTLTHEVITPFIDPLLSVGYSCVYWIDYIYEVDKSGFERNQRSWLLKKLKQPFVPLKERHMHDLNAMFF